MRSKGIKRRAIRKPNNTSKDEILSPKCSRKSYSSTEDYKYFEGHLVPEVAKNLPAINVYCWKDENLYSLYMCAVFKFWQQRRHCRKCPLFQDDEYTQPLKDLIEEWEKDTTGEDKSGDQISFRISY